MAERKSYLLRLDPALWVELERLAAQELRSVNGQIEALLREALVARGRPLPPAAPRRRGRPSAEGSPEAPGEA